MNIQVEYIDTRNVTSNRNYELSWLGFIKHLAIAGQGYAPKPQKLMRTIGMLLHYSQYMRWREFDNNRFSEPPIFLSDPTEKGQFSNLAGKAIADFLSKKIDRSIYTVNYEAAMRMRNMSLYKVSRPDLIAFTRNSMFALEAKGFSGGCGNMATHKLQSQQGGIPVNFSVACVSYDLYSQVKCNYHDPFNQDAPFDSESLQRLTQVYYSGLEGFLNQDYFGVREVVVSGESFYEIDLIYRRLRRLSRDIAVTPWILWELFDFYRPKILLPKNIRDYADSGVTREIQPFSFEQEPNNFLYVDNDRVGLRFERI